MLSVQKEIWQVTTLNLPNCCLARRLSCTTSSPPHDPNHRTTKYSSPALRQLFPVQYLPIVFLIWREIVSGRPPSENWKQSMAYACRVRVWHTPVQFEHCMTQYASNWHSHVLAMSYTGSTNVMEFGTLILHTPVQQELTLCRCF